ncbi:alpha-1,2-fucosyltransferase [Bacteroidia bacterium]|nr:alpha-1,2-fucosyltransferase [Bacteroidia bacterium]
MKIVKILGGLGNQMFQYAFYLSLQQRFPEEIIKIDCTLFNGYPLHNGLEINRLFNIDLTQASFHELLRVTWPLYNYRLYQIARIILPKRNTHYIEDNESSFDGFAMENNYYFDGYWQNEYYFKKYTPLIKKVFQFRLQLGEKNRYLMQKLMRANSISIHVRRGDYLNHKIYLEICEKNYYEKAITYMKQILEYPFFFVFSNDINWCKNNLKYAINNSPVEYIDWNINENSHIDMKLMSECKHNIIANSSFSWWGAWLNSNPDKIVVAPKRWLNNDLKLQPQCKEWILI